MSPQRIIASSFIHHSYKLSSDLWQTISDVTKIARVLPAITLLILLSIFGVTACAPAGTTGLNQAAAGSDQPAAAADDQAAASNTIIDLLASRGEFSQLLVALEATDLATRLRSEKSLTLFAPTDAAFEKLARETGTLNNAESLQQILRYHIINDTQDIEALLKLRKIVTSNSMSVTVVTDTIGVRVNNAVVLEQDLATDNGFIHTIDTVLTHLAPDPKDAPSDLNPELEVWEPYLASVRLPINDAELVPGHPVVRNALLKVSNPLQENGALINIARTVRLYHEGQVTYLAPRGKDIANDFEKLKNSEPVIIGVIAYANTLEQQEPDQSYIVRIYDYGESEPGATKAAIELLDENGSSVSGLQEGEALVLPVSELFEELPAAGLFYGTTWAKIAYTWDGNYYCYCVACVVVTCQFANKNACQAACSN